MAESLPAAEGRGSQGKCTGAIIADDVGIVRRPTSLRINSRAQALRELRWLGSNSTLTSLNISSASLGNDEAGLLADALCHNTTLTTLDLWRNAIGVGGAGRLAEALARNSTLTELNLGYNDFGDQGAAFLATGLASNSSLRKLDLYGDRVGATGARRLAQGLAANFSLTSLRFTSSFSVVIAMLERNKQFQAERFRIRRTLGDWRTVINVKRYKRYLGWHR